MAIPEEAMRRIIEAIQAKMGGQTAHCTICGNNTWGVDGYVATVLGDGPLEIRISGNVLPMVALSCRNCGNTNFLNLLVLGLGDLVKAAPDGPK